MTDDNERCETCAHWNIADAAPSIGGTLTDYDLEALDRLDPNDEHDAAILLRTRLPHANLNWSKCTAAPEGWDDFDPALHKMAVWDGSTYRAQLLTRCDHICGQYCPRRPRT